MHYILKSITLIKAITLGKKSLEMELLKLSSLGFHLHTCVCLCACKHARVWQCWVFLKAFSEHFWHPLHCTTNGSMVQPLSSRDSQSLEGERVAVDYIQSCTAESCFPRGWCFSLVNVTDVWGRGRNGPGAPYLAWICSSKMASSR